MSTVTNPPPSTTLGDRIEAAYSRIGVTSAHVGIVAMILFGVFFDAI